MRKSAANLSWDDIDEAGLRAGIAAIEDRDRRAADAGDVEPNVRFEADSGAIPGGRLSARIDAKRKTSKSSGGAPVPKRSGTV